MAIIFHLVGIVLSIWLAFQLRFDFVIPVEFERSFRIGLIYGGGGFILAILGFRLHQGLWRFFTLRDCFISTLAIGAGTIFAGITVYLANGGTFVGFPRSTLIIAAMILLFWEIGSRGLLRMLREHRIKPKTDGSSRIILLVGKPDEADLLLRQMGGGGFGKVAGLVSHRQRHKGQQLRGVPIYSPDDDLAGLARDKRVSTVLFLPPLNTPSTMRDVMDSMSASGINCEYRFMPSMEDIASGRLSVEQTRRVSIEDLLHRPSHKIDLDLVASSIRGKDIMVTGAGGSIGSEICRQVVNLRPSSLTLFESSEFALFEIEREIEAETRELGVKLKGITGDVLRANQLRTAIEANGVDVLYHAAAYKHVHLMERNPVSCFLNNVVGTHTAATVAEECGVDEFVLISTDKAVRPTSLMGASKRLAERVIIERPSSETRFKAVRFGNVLGSSGSVVPIFKKQIANGGPVTVTSREVTRYFMTIPEAVELVLAAGAVAEDRRICVLEMGEPVKIDSLARRMIELSGLVPDVDIPIVYTGLKPGEKENEELLTDDEGVVRTDHDRIWVVEKSAEVEAPPLDIVELIEVLEEGDPDSIRKFAHQNVPRSLLMV